MTNTCAGCDALWTGLQACHCAACHRTFSGVSLFDRHRRLRGENGYCVDPATITDRGHPVRQDPHTGIWRGRPHPEHPHSSAAHGP